MFGFEIIGISKISSKYILCVYGRSYVRSCLFSETRKRCDYAHKLEGMKGNSVVSPGEVNNKVTYTPDCSHALNKVYCSKTTSTTPATEPTDNPTIESTD